MFNKADNKTKRVIAGKHPCGKEKNRSDVGKTFPAGSPFRRLGTRREGRPHKRRVFM
jgi:hypothetical protein